MAAGALPLVVADHRRAAPGRVREVGPARGAHAVVDDDVGESLHSAVVQGGDGLLELGLGPVFRVLHVPAPGM